MSVKMKIHDRDVNATALSLACLVLSVEVWNG